MIKAKEDSPTDEWIGWSCWVFVGTTYYTKESKWNKLYIQVIYEYLELHLVKKNTCFMLSEQAKLKPKFKLKY